MLNWLLFILLLVNFYPSDAGGLLEAASVPAAGSVWWLRVLQGSAVTDAT